MSPDPSARSIMAVVLRGQPPLGREMVPFNVKLKVLLLKLPSQTAVPWPLATAKRPVRTLTIYGPRIW